MNVQCGQVEGLGCARVRNHGVISVVCESRIRAARNETWTCGNKQVAAAFALAEGRRGERQAPAVLLRQGTPERTDDERCRDVRCKIAVALHTEWQMARRVGRWQGARRGDWGVIQSTICASSMSTVSLTDIGSNGTPAPARGPGSRRVALLLLPLAIGATGAPGRCG